MELDRHAGEAPVEGVGEGVELGPAHVGVGEEDLAVQVGDLDPIVVRDAEGPDAGRRQRERRRRADAAGADDHHEILAAVHGSDGAAGALADLPAAFMRARRGGVKLTPAALRR